MTFEFIMYALHMRKFLLFIYEDEHSWTHMIKTSEEKWSLFKCLIDLFYRKMRNDDANKCLMLVEN